MGLLDDAAPLFRAGSRVPGAGVLLAIPVILETGVLDSAREVYGSIGPTFFGLRTSVVSLAASDADTAPREADCLAPPHPLGTQVTPGRGRVARRLG